MKTNTTYLAGGCFWGLEALLKTLPGVVDTEVGYMGGTNEHPTYEQHDGHAEAVRVTYNPDVLTLTQLLDFFFRIHDPTIKNQQGNDIGTSYRSAIFYQTEAERQTAEVFIARVNDSKRWNAPVVTTLEPYTAFWPAEDYHQDYLDKHPGGYTCHAVRFGSYE